MASGHSVPAEAPEGETSLLEFSRAVASELTEAKKPVVEGRDKPSASSLSKVVTKSVNSQFVQSPVADETAASPQCSTEVPKAGIGVPRGVISNVCKVKDNIDNNIDCPRGP